MSTKGLLRDSATRSSTADPTDIASTLRTTLKQAMSRTGANVIGAGARESLRPIVRKFALAHRARHETPEGTLIALKQVIGEVDRTFIDERVAVDYDAEHTLISEIIAWCIEDYYRDE